MQNKKIGKYTPSTAEAYCKTFGTEVECNNELDRFFLGLVPNSLGGKFALDLGAGNGRYSELLHNRSAKRVIAFDLSESMLEQVTKRKLSRQLNRLDVVQGDLENLPFSKNSIDYIFSRFSLMYVCDLHALIQRLGEIMTDNGEMLVLANFSTIKNTEAVVKTDPVPLNLRIGENSVAIKNYPNTLQDYLSAFQKAGFTVETTQQFPAHELSVDETYPYADLINFKYVVFHLRKKRK